MKNKYFKLILIFLIIVLKIVILLQVNKKYISLNKRKNELSLGFSNWKLFND